MAERARRKLMIYRVVKERVYIRVTIITRFSPFVKMPIEQNEPAATRLPAAR
jgi:hypothetical protein